MPPTDAAPFDTLAALRANHSRLLQAPKPPAGVPTERAAAVVEFLARVKATGRRLDTPADRETAQGILDYWTATLFALPVEPAGRIDLSELIPDTPPGSVNLLLDKYAVEEARATVAVVEAWFAALSPEDQNLTQQILMRLVRMPESGRVPEVKPVALTELGLAPADAIDRLLRELERVGAVTVSRADPPASAVVALGSDALTREWPAFADWVKKRVEFRGAVRYWHEHKDVAGKEEALIRGELLRDAEQYHDLNTIERAFLAASRVRDSRATAYQRFWKRVFASLAAAAVMLAITAVMLAIATVYSQEQVADTKLKAEQQHRSATEEAAKKQVKFEAEKAALEQAKREAVQAKGEFESTMTFALAKLVMSENFHAVHAAKKILMIQTLGQVLFADGPDAARAVRRNWHELREMLIRDRVWFKQLLEDAKWEPRIKEVTTADAPSHTTKQSLLDLSRKVREDMQLDEPTSVYLPYLNLMKPIWFGQAQQSTALVVQAAEAGRPLETARVLVNLFRRLYCGEMVLIEGSRVAGAMVAFEEAVREWEKAGADKPASDDVKAALGKAAERLRTACAAELKETQK